MAQTSETAPANLPAQKIGADDLVAISVYDSPELTRTVRVSGEGQIRLPMMKRPIEAAGLFPRDLETAIAAALRSEQILVDPVVTVTVAEYRSRPISVSGAVKRPVTFQASGSITLLDAITRAEGLAPEAGTEILLTRHGVDGKSATDRIPVKALFQGDQPGLNPRLSGGEEIRVPEAGRIFVAGSVKNPGAFTMKDGPDTSVLKVLALAGGLIPFSSKQAYIYRRKAGAEAKDEIPIPLAQIMGRKSPDIPLAADDILYVPDAKGRRLSAAALERIAGFGAATASGLLIWH
ncbi:MAG: polysaccharide biosynthesis/export family protein [Acidobacteriia bacterium]|nr:polysaccharide biosynthesis/export family protein [Terriglobia bacterium]